MTGINIEGADAYFASHAMGKAWKEYAPEQRKAAIEQAKRDFSRALGRPMNENEAPYRYGDETRDEYAVYEQALYSLLRFTLPNGGGADIPSLEPDEKADRKKTLSKGGEKWSEEALAWLGAVGRVEIMKG